MTAPVLPLVLVMAAASDLWASDDGAAWTSHLESLEARLAASGKKTKYGALGPLHARWAALGPRLRAAGCLGKADLKTVMAYKLTRGKMRPLMRFVDAAADADVRATSKAALAALDAADAAPACAAFDSLAGVGVATASLIFAAASERFPVMSDVALEACCGAPAHGKTYDVAAYEALRGACASKAAALGGDWTPRAVELALFSASHAAAPAPRKRKRG